MLVALALLLSGAAASVWIGCFRPQASKPAGPAVGERIDWNRPDLPSPDPRTSYTGVFQNVAPGVRYVGSKVCAECHEDIARSYAEHPMARSIIPVAAAADLHPADAAHHNPFAALGFSLSVAVDNKRMFHRVSRGESGGQPIYQLSMEVGYAVGSGSHGHSYLSDRDGYLFQTPISWYSEKKIWDLSPGFSGDLIVGRPVSGECLFCHANRAQPWEGTLNRYRAPLIVGPEIGCERCHGPGEKHVASAGPLAKGEVDRTIVNPRHLQPGLREAVCQQCHLHGEVRILPRGRDLYDFRPGLPLESCWSVFVNPRASAEDKKKVNQAEQMYLSACFQRSPEENKLGCISCHDPHQAVRPERRVAFYRNRCLKCHADAGCTVPISERKLKNQDNCSACHMPSYASADIVHNSSTDHRIIRRPDEDNLPAPGPASLKHFHAAGMKEDGRELQRDLGMALVQWVLAGKGKLGHAQQAIPLLDKALEENPHDWEAWEKKARGLLLVGRFGDALAAAETVASKAPEREVAVVLAGTAAQKLGKPDLARAYWKRAVDANPWMAFYRANLVTLLASQNAWDEVGPQCREWLKLDPGNVDARKIWIEFEKHSAR